MAMRILRFALSPLLAFIILFLGCQHAAVAYRLRRDGLDPVLFPPTAGNYNSALVSIAVKHARQRNPNTANCDIAGELLSLRWEKSTAEIAFHSQAFFASDNQSSSQVGRVLYVDPLVAIDKFLMELTERQSKGCLSSIESERLRRAIVENLPLPPAIAYFLQLGSYDVTGHIDLTPDFRMQVTSPICSPDTEASVASLLGYETANYIFVRDESENRMRLRLASASEVLISGEKFEKQTLHNELPFSKSLGYFRLLFMGEESASNRITRAILLSASDQNQFPQAVPPRGMSPDEFCATVSVTKVNCAVFPKNFGVSPELRIRVNQKDAFLRVGGMVQEVLNLEMPDAGPPASLKILRPFHGPSNPDQI
ncbi:MAG TPA: hypothetical protein VJN92_12680 [Candidatus Acidoferrum sp.]|nr:hypothetical protein [Candidatus Acidoferrum sp.]